MNAQPSTVARRRIGLAGVAVAAMLLTGCAAGQLAQTSVEKASIDGTNETIGQIGLRGLAITAPATGNYYPAGSAIAMQVIFVNNGTTADTLTSITSSAITSWGTYANTAQARLVQQAATAVPTTAAPATSAVPSTTSSTVASSGSTSSAPGSATSSRTAKPSASASSSASPTATPVPRGGRTVAIGAGSRASFGLPDRPNVLLLLGSKGRIYPGNSVQITFTFARAGSITVTVPVQLSEGGGGTQVVSGAAESGS